MAQREFPAVLSKVRDGDTVYVWCDMGYDTWRYTKLRIMASPKLGIACRELSQPGGKEAKDYMIGLLPPRTYPDEGAMFFNDTATTEIYTLCLHDALPI